MIIVWFSLTTYVDYVVYQFIRVLQWTSQQRRHSSPIEGLSWPKATWWFMPTRSPCRALYWKDMTRSCSLTTYMREVSICHRTLASTSPLHSHHIVNLILIYGERSFSCPTTMMISISNPLKSSSTVKVVSPPWIVCRLERCMFMLITS